MTTIDHDHGTEEAISDNCRVCGHPRRDHPFRHAFVGFGSKSAKLQKAEPSGERPSGDDSSSEAFSSSQAQIKKLPGGDPILRMALIRAGVISPADLVAVEEELRATGISYSE